MAIHQKVALGLGSGLLVGSVAPVLPNFQFWCFVAGLILSNYAMMTKSK
ncbi:hypothetical protein L4D09_14395 [Photobacterium makurazakiensis]